MGQRLLRDAGTVICTSRLAGGGVCGVIPSNNEHTAVVLGSWFLVFGKGGRETLNNDYPCFIVSTSRRAIL